MRAKLYINGMKEPKELRFTEAKEAERIIADVMIVPETPFIVEGVWSGKKKDMRYVDWEADNSHEEGEEIVITDLEFQEIAKEFEVARLVASRGGFDSSYYKDFWFQLKGAIRLDIKLNWNNEKYYSVMVRDPQKYIKAQKLLDAYDRKNYGKLKEEERLEKMAIDN